MYLKKHSIKTLEYQKWKEILNNGNINNYLESIILNTEKLKQIKREKNRRIKNKKVLYLLKIVINLLHI